MPLKQIGSYFMIGQDQEAAGAVHGLKGGELYFRGRAAPIDGIDADRAAAVYRTFPKGLLQHVFSSTAAVDDASVATAYEQAAAHAAQRLLAPDYPAELDELPDLVRAVLGVAELREVDATAVLRSWRDRAWPAQDGPLGAYWALVLLRELRGARHFEALDEAGLDTLHAAVADPSGGPQVMAEQGWRSGQIAQIQQQTDARPDLAERRKVVEDATDAALLADLSAVLTDEQIERLGMLVQLADDTARKAPAG